MHQERVFSRPDFLENDVQANLKEHVSIVTDASRRDLFHETIFGVSSIGRSF